MIHETKKTACATAYAGVDIGSLMTKSVIFSGGKVLSSVMQLTGVKPEETGHQAFLESLDIAGLTPDEIGYTIATGYGRITADYADKLVTEITCHAKGAHHIHPETRTIIDMGGQDCKVIRIDKTGKVLDFAMNDKCAAGTGRFLEVMASVFKVSLDELGPMAQRADDMVPISSTCTIFAESEVISLAARGERPENILKGVHDAISNRIAGMTSRVGVADDLLFTGGVAKNIGMKDALSESIGSDIVIPAYDPQLIGALGAAVLASNSGPKV
jgi:predicted CoA-substrate-specific enzyme activase